MTAHVGSFVILCRPQTRHSVHATIAALPGVEVHHCGADGRIVAVTEGRDERQVGETLTRLQSAPGVIAANMVYHGIDESPEDDPGNSPEDGNGD